MTALYARPSGRALPYAPRAFVMAVVALLFVLVAGACSGETTEPTAAVSDSSAPAPASRAGSDDVAARTEPSDQPSPTPGPAFPPVPIDATTTFGDGVQIRLSSIEAVYTQGSGPGERSGDGVRIAVEITNGKSSTISLDNVTVDLVYATALSAYRVTSPDDEQLAGDVAPGSATTGSYLFTIAAEQRRDVTIRVKYSADTPTVVFAGDLPDA